MIRALRAAWCRLFGHDLLPLASHITRRDGIIHILCMRCGDAQVWE